jgi:RNA polymerase sigma-70 factor (ECF subfamily)
MHDNSFFYDYNEGMMIFLFSFSDEELRKIKARDPLIFEKIFKDYYKAVYNFIIIKSKGNKAMAEEIFSDTFFSALQSAPNLRNPDKILQWLLQIANRRFIDYLRRKYKMKKNEDKNGLTDDIPYKDNSFENIENNEKAILLNIALENIKPEYKKILKLKYNENKTQREISEILGKTISSVESILFRARESLKKELKKMAR